MTVPVTELKRLDAAGTGGHGVVEHVGRASPEPDVGSGGRDSRNLTA